MNNICIYCGSSSGNNPLFSAAARELGSLLAARNIGLIYGGAGVGIMGHIADAVLAGGGKAVGVMPESLVAKEVAHQGLTRLHVVKSMHERKMAMADMADGFIALPGGLGTLEEIFEVLTWAQLGFHQKPCAMYNVGNYYEPLLEFLANSVREGFVKQRHLDMVLVANSAHGLLELLAGWQPVIEDKWSDREPNAR